MICALSGGVDTVVALLINKAIKKSYLYYGRYRLDEKNEFKYTYDIFKKYNLNVKLVDASKFF